MVFNQILTLKQADSQTDTSVLEAEIDAMVYELYELTAAEILIVEGKWRIFILMYYYIAYFWI